MPDQSLFYPALYDPLYDFIGSFVLLKTGDYFYPPFLFVGSKQGEVLLDVQQTSRM